MNKRSNFTKKGEARNEGLPKHKKRKEEKLEGEGLPKHKQAIPNFIKHHD